MSIIVVKSTFCFDQNSHSEGHDLVLLHPWERCLKRVVVCVCLVIPVLYHPPLLPQPASVQSSSFSSALAQSSSIHPALRTETAEIEINDSKARLVIWQVLGRNSCAQRFSYCLSVLFYVCALLHSCLSNASFSMWNLLLPSHPGNLNTFLGDLLFDFMHHYGVWYMSACFPGC